MKDDGRPQSLAASRLQRATLAAAILGLAACACTLFGPNQNCPPPIYVPPERIHLQLLSFSQFLHGRSFWVFLPPDYSRSTDRYPVLYMLDGQSAMGPGASWRADQTAEHLIDTHAIRPIIIVAITAIPESRTFEYTPWADSLFTAGPSGGGDAFLRDMSLHLIPYIDTHFRTRANQVDRYICGASYGGLLVTYAGYAYDSIFSRAAAVSPSYWWKQRYVFGFVRARGRGLLARFYQDTGTEGDQDPALLREMEEDLRAQGFIPGQDLETVIAPGERHNPHCWGHRFPEILRFLTSD